MSTRAPARPTGAPLRTLRAGSRSGPCAQHRRSPPARDWRRCPRTSRTRRRSCPWRIAPPSPLHGLLVLTEDVLQSAIDLAERRVRLDGLHDGRHEVTLAARLVGEAAQGAAGGGGIPLAP